MRVQGNSDRSYHGRRKNMVDEAVEMFLGMENWDGLAAIFITLPSCGLSLDCPAFGRQR